MLSVRTLIGKKHSSVSMQSCTWQRVHHSREEQAADIYRSINTEGTLPPCPTRCQSGSEPVHLVLVNGSSTDGRLPFREDDRLLPRGVYGASKAAAEAGLEAMVKDTEMNIAIVIRPPLIYGVGALGNFRLLATAVDRGIPLSVRGEHQYLTRSSALRTTSLPRPSYSNLQSGMD